MPLRRTLAEVQKRRIKGFEPQAAAELNPAQLSQTGRRELRYLFKSHDVEVAAVYAPLRRGLDVSENLDARLDYLKQALTLSCDLGPRLVVAPFGKVPEENDARWLVVKNALMDLARHGDHVGARLALEAGLDPGDTVRGFLEKFDTGSLAACFNPGALLAAGHNVEESLRALREKTVHVHARDAQHISAMGRAQEVAVGQGDVDWMGLAATLEEIDYAGWLVIDGENLGAAAIDGAVGLIRSIFGA